MSRDYPTDSTDYATATASVPLTVSSGTTAPIYSYSITNGSSSGYEENGNISHYTDSVTGTWSMVSGSSGGYSGYDSLNRLGAATQVLGSTTTYFCWSYDSFGNRTYQQAYSGAAFTNTAAVGNTCTPGSGATLLSSEWNSYLNSSSVDPGTNQVQSTNASGATATLSYDAAGNVTYDGSNYYAYDGDGRQCAVSHTVAGVTTYTGYVYDAEGNRVAKGTLASFSCTATLTVTNTYILDQSNQQITETDGSGNWIHSNVFAAGSLIATYDYKSDGTNPLSFNLQDWLGTKRVVTDYEGTTTEKWSSLPFGDGLTQLYGSTDDTEHHFTGKERDAESGNDFFEARYYANNMGRFLMPDWTAKTEPVPYAKMDDPQSLNLYSYVYNNPLSSEDPDGHAVFQSADALQKAGDKVMAQKDLQPYTTVNAKGEVVHHTFCNFGVQDILHLGGDHTLDPTKSDNMNAVNTTKFLQDPKNATVLSSDDAVKYAKAGATVVYAEGDPKNPHVAVVAPTDMVKAGSTWTKTTGEKMVPQVMNVGTSNGTKALDMAFGKHIPTAYILNTDKSKIDQRK